MIPRCLRLRFGGRGVRVRTIPRRLEESATALSLDSVERDAVLVTRGLTKTYGSVRALRGVSLEVKRGEIFGLLGPNGSGKTTTIRILLGMLRATAGEARIAGLDSWTQSVEVRRLVSFLPGEIRLFGHFTGRRMLRFLSRLRDGVPYEAAVALAEGPLGLGPALDRKVRGYSTGMKQKLALAQAFADPVEILILDEPTSALDPSARALVLDLVRQARQRGQTIIFSGHVLSEVEKVCDRVAIMRTGRLLWVEDLAHRRRGYRLLLLRFADPQSVPTSWPEHLELQLREWVDPRTVLMEHRGAPPPLLDWLAQTPLIDLAIGTDDLQSLYDRYHGPNALSDDEVEDYNPWRSLPSHHETARPNVANTNIPREDLVA